MRGQWKILTAANGQEVMVNLVLIRAVTPSDGSTCWLWFDSEHRIQVEGTLKEVEPQLTFA